MNKQMNPVLLPKRKEFGFLKPPSSSVTSSMSMNGSVRRKDLINNNNNNNNNNHHGKLMNASNARLINSKETSSKQAYIFDPLKIKYEIGNHLFGKSYTNRQTSSSQLMSKSTAVVSTSTPPKSDSITSPHRLFRGMTGYNVRNKIKRHQLLSLPINFTTNINKTNNNNNKLNNKGMSKLDATQFLEQLINKRKEKSIYNQNCRNCGINYFENNKCLYCEYNNSSSNNNNTNVVWLPNLARQTITTAAFTTTTTTNNNNNNKHENSFTFAIPESETSVSISSKLYRYAALSGKDQSFLKKKATTDIDFFSIKKPTTTYETTQKNLKKINENNNNNRDEKVKSTASDYYGDSTLIDETDDSLNINNNRNNVSYVSNNDFNYNTQHTSSFQQYDSNYKYDSSKEEDGQENDYQNVVPKLTLWLV
jgi:hypothetical protein